MPLEGPNDVKPLDFIVSTFQRLIHAKTLRSFSTNYKTIEFVTIV